ncbi:hypothetical protein CsatB_024145 [Cannabis sativa]
MSYYNQQQQQPPIGVPPPQGYPPKDAYPPPGYPAEGYPPQGYPPQQAYPQQGYPPQGYAPQYAQEPPRKETGCLEGWYDFSGTLLLLPFGGLLLKKVLGPHYNLDMKSSTLGVSKYKAKFGAVADGKSYLTIE